MLAHNAEGHVDGTGAAGRRQGGGPRLPPPDILEKMLGDGEGTPYWDLYMSNPEAFCDAITTEDFVIKISKPQDK